MIVSARTRIAGVMGWPVAHSRSPRLHGWWLERYGIDGVYLPFAVAPERIEQAIRALPALGVRGVNITVPHKEVALRCCDRVDPAARRIGAVNTLVVDDQGLIEGRNTDGLGFLMNVREGAPEWCASSGPAVVVGAGGAARAVLVALLEAGVPELRLINRSPERAMALAREVGGPVVPWPWERRSEALRAATLLVNATTLGMSGQPALDLPLTDFPLTGVVNDLVYTPLITPLLEAAQTRGNYVVDGLGMLLHQAVPGFEAWFSHRPEVTPELRRVVLA